jgi:folate-binding protein YgfZ
VESTTRYIILILDSAEYTPSETDPNVMTTDSICFHDPRLSALGCRVICPEDSLEIEDEFINKKLDMSDYEVIRMLYGVGEGNEIKDQFPLNMNFQHLNAISFNKGCYIGQELTQRTYHTGVIRKMLMPFICADKLIYSMDGKFILTPDSVENFIVIPFQSLNKNFNKNLKGLTVKNEKGEEIGTVLANHHNCGLAIIDKEKIEKSGKLNIENINTVIYDPLTLYESVREVIKDDEKK